MDFANDGPRRPGEVGIDLGIAQTVTLSDGTVFQLDVESIKKHEKQIAVLQRQLCRNKEARQKLAKLGKANPFDKREPKKTEGEDSESPSLYPQHSSGLHA